MKFNKVSTFKIPDYGDIIELEGYHQSRYFATLAENPEGEMFLVLLTTGTIESIRGEISDNEIETSEEVYKIKNVFSDVIVNL